MTKKIIALVGRPNVGKSTLFNRLSIRKRAIVHDKAGVTRDRKYADASLGSFEFTIVDTPGLEEAEENKLEQRMMLQTISAISEADLVCLIVDGREGVTPMDQFFAKFIRKYTTNHIVIANKCEKQLDFDHNYYKLGFGNPIAISAEHAIGLSDLYEAMDEKLLISKNVAEQIEPEEQPEQKQMDNYKEKNLSIVISGRPNAGKSTFINAILQTERLLTGPEAGITRESIEIDWQYKNYQLKLIDTAGLRKKRTVHEDLEKLSTGDTTNSINFANVVVLMMDAEQSLEQQDLNIANLVIDQGRALVIAVNKFDLIKEPQQYQKQFFARIEQLLPQVKGVPVIFFSSIKAKQINQVLDEAIKIYQLWNKRIATSKLNEWLELITEAHPLPLQKGGRRVRIKYMTQIKTRPPTFKLFSNLPEKISDSYQRYLVNSLRENFNLPGVPIRFYFDKSANPYDKK